VSTTAYVEASVVRGERSTAILARDVVPNIAEVIFADFGIRFGYSVILIASMNFLGVGLQPPTADWGLMVAENRQLVAINPWAVLAPAILLAILTISVNLVGDAYVRTLGRSSA
jgi:ABC-type dipeptide/oligopeptide/nickel transport system permease subunit